MNEWIINNWIGILVAAIAGLYTTARAIVVLTPTPKDDVAVKKIGKLLKAISKIFGLDLTQGIHKK